MKRLSVVISARNEEQKLPRCLASVRWADEVIVVDNESTDGTAAFAKAYGAKVFSRKNNFMLNVNKNFGFEKTQGEWILSLDADEEIPQVLAHEIQSSINKKGAAGFWISRKNILFGKWIRHGLWWPDKQLRLFRRGNGRFPCIHVHEYLEVDGPTGELHEPYIHYNYESISQFIGKMDTIYTESEVQKLTRTRYQLLWYDALRFPASDFVKVFFAQEGYKDGLHGLVLAILQAFYSFIVFAKMWERRKFPDVDVPLESISEELKKNVHDINYWEFTSMIKQSTSPLKRLWLKLLRRL